MLPHCEPGDIIIDGGNEYYVNTERRTKQVEAAGLLYVGCGVSGGEEGISSLGHRRCACVVGCPTDRHVPLFDAEDAFDDTDGDSPMLENRPLLDVQLEVRREGAGRSTRRFEAVGVATDELDTLAQRFATHGGSIEGFHPEPGDFARLHLGTTNTDITVGPRPLDLRRRLVRDFGGTLEVSVSGLTTRIRVAEQRELDFVRINQLCRFAGFRLDVLAVEADVSVADGSVTFTATGQCVPLEAGSQTPDLPSERRWVRILGSAPAWPFGARLLERESNTDAANFSAAVSVSAGG